MYEIEKKKKSDAAVSVSILPFEYDKDFGKDSKGHLTRKRMVQLEKKKKNVETGFSAIQPGLP